MSKDKETKKARFFELLDRAVLPSGQSTSEKLGQKRSGGYSGKRTHQHKSVNTSGKQRGKSRQ